MFYRLEIHQTDDGFVCVIPDLKMETVPQLTEREAIDGASKAMSGFIELEYRRKHKPIPLPSPVGKDDRVAYVPLRLQLRITLWNAMIRTGVTQVELAAKLNISKGAVNQYVNGSSNIGPEAYERALIAIGEYPNITTQREN